MEKIHSGNFFSTLIASGYTEEHEAYSKKTRNKAFKIPKALKTLDDFSGEEISNFTSLYERNDDFKGISKALDATRIAMDELEEYLGDHPDPPTIHVIVVGYPSQNEYAIETGWFDINARQNVLWSRTDVELEDIHIFLAMCEITCTAYTRYENRTKPVAFEPCALYRYHPERFRQNRKYFSNAWGRLKSNIHVPAGAITGMEALQSLAGDVIGEVNDKRMKSPLKGRTNDAMDFGVVNRELEMLTTVAIHRKCGRQILDIDPNLSEMFKKTGVEDIPLDMIQLPYTSQYIYFGPQEDIQLSNGWFFDGAYVERYEKTDSLRITITTVPDKATKTRLWYTVPEPSFRVEIPNASSKVSLIIAVTEAFSKMLAELNSRKNTFDEMEMGGAKFVDVTERNNVFRLEELKSSFPVFEKALNLIANAACYLSAYPEDHNPVWPTDAPARLIKQYNEGSPKERNRAESKLASMGYTQVMYFGKHFKSNISEPTGTVETHWRRGHWRNQPYGPKNTLRKLKWLMPMLIGAGNDGDDAEPKGHIYTVN